MFTYPMSLDLRPARADEIGLYMMQRSSSAFSMFLLAQCAPCVFTFAQCTAFSLRR